MQGITLNKTKLDFHPGQLGNVCVLMKACKASENFPYMARNGGRSHAVLEDVNHHLFVLLSGTENWSPLRIVGVTTQ